MTADQLKPDKLVRGQAVVESLVLTGHPKATRAYGWAYDAGKETRYMAVLEIPPVTSPNTLCVRL